MVSVHIVEIEATKSDFSISDSVKIVDERTLSHQTERDSMNDLTICAQIVLQRSFFYIPI
jgi:hypothetical protein